MIRNTLATIRRTLRSTAIVVCGVIVVWAPTVSASIAENELDAFAKYPLYQACGASASTGVAGITIAGTSTVISGDPLTVNSPNITDAGALGAAIEGFIRGQRADSPWLAIPSFGSRFVAESQKYNVNPLLIVAIGLKETGFGTANTGSALDNNSFGNKGDGPRGYKVWPSFEASLIGDDSFTAHMGQERVSQPPESRVPVNYAPVTNMYEYVSVHLSGQVIYPGDTKTSYDSLMNQAIDSTNVIKYFSQVRDWIGEITGLEISGIPQRPTGGADVNASRTAGSSCNSVAKNGCGQPNDDGYAWPVAPCTKILYSGFPTNYCKKDNGSYGPRYNGPYSTRLGTTHDIQTCHGNPSPATDLFFGDPQTEMGGKAVYAIADGEIVNMSGGYGGVPECYQIQFHSTVENRYYWYGHLQNPNVQPSQKDIKAGQQIAEVGDWSLKSRGCSPGPPHLHIDRGCVNDNGSNPQNGGYDNCRDYKFLTDMQKLWDALPEDPNSPFSVESARAKGLLQ